MIELIIKYSGKIFSWSTEAMAFWAIVLGLVNLISQHLPRFLKPEVSFLVTPKLLVLGFGELGPSITLQYVVPVTRKDVFVQNIDMEIRASRVNSTEEHHMSWLYLNELRVDPQKPFDLPRLAVKESASPFLASTRNPPRLYMSFFDRTARDEIANIINEESLNFRNRIGTEILGIMDEDELRTTLLDSNEMRNAEDRIGRENYWRNGQY